MIYTILLKCHLQSQPEEAILLHKIKQTDRQIAELLVIWYAMTLMCHSNAQVPACLVRCLHGRLLKVWGMVNHTQRLSPMTLNSAPQLGGVTPGGMQCWLTLAVNDISQRTSDSTRVVPLVGWQTEMTTFVSNWNCMPFTFMSVISSSSTSIGDAVRLLTSSSTSIAVSVSSSFRPAIFSLRPIIDVSFDIDVVIGVVTVDHRQEDWPRLVIGSFVLTQNLNIKFLLLSVHLTFRICLVTNSKVCLHAESVNKKKWHIPAV